MLAFISEARRSFPNLQIIVFSGGEPILMGQSLYRSIALANELGLSTRVVTNGYWGKSQKLALRTAKELAEHGLKEINISTGKDHAQYVPIVSVINAIIALAEAGIKNRVTVESDYNNEILDTIMGDPRVSELIKNNPSLLSFQTNCWMPFHKDSELRPLPLKEVVDSPCSQLFENIVLTPHKQISACCGLTFEHIKEMKLGSYSSGKLTDLYKRQFDDFLKVWIAVAGPVKIVQEVLGNDAQEHLGEIHHGCQACAVLHQSSHIREKLKERYVEYMPEVMEQFIALKAINKIQAKGI